MHVFYRTLNVFYRDFYVFFQRIQHSLLNFAIIVPATLTLTFGYFLPNTVLAHASALETTTLFAGSIMWAMFPFTFSIQSNLLYDLTHERFIDYQLTFLPASAIIIERILSCSFIAFAHSIFYFPLAKLIMRETLLTTNTNWPALFLIIYCSSLVCSAYNLFVVNYAKSMPKVRNFWVRVNFPLMQVGGFFFSYKTLYSFNKMLGYICLLNPFTYITEGLRKALLGSSDFFSLYYSISGLCIFSLFFTWLALYFFKKNVDCI